MNNINVPNTTSSGIPIGINAFRDFFHFLRTARLDADMERSGISVVYADWMDPLSSSQAFNDFSDS